MRTRRLLACVVFVAAAVMCASAPASAKIIKGYQGIELGMDSATVVKLLETNKADIIRLKGQNGVSAMIKNDKLFRHADFLFDESGVLREIVLFMREVVKESRIISRINTQYNINLSRDNTIVRDGVAVSVKGNTVLIRDAQKMVVKAPAKTKEPRGAE
ncbi:MAG: hypothetical protein AB1646_03720 [Thermodesulfobacteriota bacterium]